MKKGTKHTSESIEKNRKSHIGQVAWNKGLKGWTKKYKNVGFQLGNKGFGTKESYARAGAKKSDSNSGTWVGGRWNYWSKRAKIREDHTCQCIFNCAWHKGKCNLKSKEIIEVDHIKPKYKFPDLKYNLDNLICLCPNCHSRKTNLEITERFKEKHEKIK